MPLKITFIKIFKKTINGSENNFVNLKSDFVIFQKCNEMLKNGHFFGSQTLRDLMPGFYGQRHKKSNFYFKTFILLFFNNLLVREMSRALKRA